MLRAGGLASVLVIDFTAPMPLDPPPAGWWWHRTFWTLSAASFSLARKDGIAALKIATGDSASMLVRFIDIERAAHPFLSWR